MNHAETPPALTFLFTDIEGSTLLWDKYPEGMKSALAQHDALLRNRIQSNGGVVFKTVGDSFYAVFPSASGALEAALASQRALVQQEWGDVGKLRVRMALHTGTAEERDGDYFGPALNRVARLLAAGHGGQTLLSLGTKEKIAESLPAEVSLRDMGERRLKDLSRPERVFQLIAPGLPSDFPPLKTMEAVPNNLPTALTSFIGREREIAEVKRLLEGTHLLTLTGAGGCGKTRLSLHVAADLLDSFSGGVWFVELGSITNPVTVPYVLAISMGVREQPPSSLLATMAGALRNKTALIILDNCEHLVEACAELTETLLRACPDLKIMTSSREALGIVGEKIWRVPSLSISDPRTAPFEAIAESEAVKLFCDRALAVAPAFLLTAENAPAVAQICQRLDGIPLAIELAAARVSVLSADQIAERLSDRFRLLTGGSRTALPRQRTLRATIDWSYDLLSNTERKLLRRISVFSGGFDLQAAETVCADETLAREGVLDLLSKLIEKSLIPVEEQEREVRYDLLEMVRQYSRDRLLESGEAERLGRRHRDYFANLVERVAPELVGPDQAKWFDRFEIEHENLRAALTWSLAEEAGVDTGLKLAVNLSRFWFIRGHFTEGRQWFSQAMALAGTLRRTSEWARALRSAGNLANNQGDYVAAISLLEEAISIFRELKDRGAASASLNQLAAIAYHQGDFSKARTLCEESLVGFRELGSSRGLATALSTLGLILQSQGDYAAARARLDESLALFTQLRHTEGMAHVLGVLGMVAGNEENYPLARSLYEKSLAMFQSLGSKQRIADTHLNLGDVALNQQDHESAQSRFTESLAIFTALGDKRGIGTSLHNLGLVAKDRGDLPGARSQFEQALRIRAELSEAENIGYSLEAFAGLAVLEGQPQKAARLYGAAETLRTAIGASMSPKDRRLHDTSVKRLQQSVAPKTLAAEWAAGRAMGIDEAVAYALRFASEERM